jgi:transcription antitermination factor NusG
MHCEEPDHPAWFAVRVGSRCEKSVSAMAQGKGIEEFLPLYECRRCWSGGSKTVKLPLFPGYVFCRLDPRHRLPLLTIPGVLHFVGIGKIPVPIEDAEIAAIQTALHGGLSAEPWRFPEVGQRVRLENGPLAGVEGILISVPTRQRIIVSISILGRSVAVEIEPHWIRSLGANGEAKLAQPAILTRPATVR